MLFKTKILRNITCNSCKKFSNAVGWALFMTKLFDVESELVVYIRYFKAVHVLADYVACSEK
jgi:hypothetical protein